ncbi:similar to Saccharomyces cerevisiae YOL086W-A MHF1 Component of the heterotetrameric MHF histone-fold complex [Geotrichum candidum]|uniref:Similar to Saccharomyces cerevisiae YOL086W-A MHF1 Component of the heterotetrameric MHF histone-fold complex n=1 Tax=Geotrichum candidum TaxID=1173061 RepID=A0A0J9XFZ7_GEOCN|nr:similar to Saccharomyces cerevisiae YOL086W-A MHF1 Component of the heterotetrameric MHF histone-fold complex [Geotrichum candidum]
MSETKQFTEDDKLLLDRLKSTIWYTVQKITAEECKQLGVTASPEYAAALTELVFNQIVTLGFDLESFARHAKRKTITTEDMKMVCRRNTGLQEVIDDYIKKLLEE